MKGCKSCFTDSSPVPLTIASSALGNCDFCAGRSVQVWPTTVWADSFARVLDIYEASDDLSAEPIHVQFQADWSVFSFAEPSLIRSFLSSAFEGGYDLIETERPVAPRYASSGPGANHERIWSEYAAELQHSNRFFPKAVLDLDALELVIRSHLDRLDDGLSLFRGRVTDRPLPHAVKEMGSPPAELATAGRANPMGIPHLYLAFEEVTALKESRAMQHSYVSLARFEVKDGNIDFLDLANLAPENPFLIEDDLIEHLAYGRYLTHLGHELSKPTRRSDNQIEYIPTQYLCDFAKSRGVGGVRYGSSLNDQGSNLVLFDDSGVECVEVRLVEVKSTEISYEFLP